MPDATTPLKFRRRLDKPKLSEALFAKVGQVLQAQGLKVGTGTFVDATIIGAPSSTKSAQQKRDPEMHQTRKGQQLPGPAEEAARRRHIPQAAAHGGK